MINFFERYKDFFSKEPKAFSTGPKEGLSPVHKKEKTVNKKTDFQKALKHTLQFEGGYVNDPHDMGGETNYGITKKTAKHHGYNGSMKSIPMGKVEEIYRKGYWDKNRLDQVCERVGYDVAQEIFDAGVNTGVSRAGKWLQKAINLLNRDQKSWTDITEDGIIGPMTLSVLSRFNGTDEAHLLKTLRALRASHYINLATKKSNQERFLRGWLKRVL